MTWKVRQGRYDLIGNHESFNKDAVPRIVRPPPHTPHTHILGLPCNSHPKFSISTRFWLFWGSITYHGPRPWVLSPFAPTEPLHSAESVTLNSHHALSHLLVLRPKSYNWPWITNWAAHDAGGARSKYSLFLPSSSLTPPSSCSMTHAPSVLLPKYLFSMHSRKDRAGCRALYFPL